MRALLSLLIFATACSSAPKVITPQVKTPPARPEPTTISSTDESCYARVESAKSQAVNSEALPHIKAAIEYCIEKIKHGRNKDLYQKLAEKCDGDYKLKDPDAASVLLNTCKLNAIAFVKSLPDEAFSSFGYKYVPPVKDEDYDDGE